MGRALWISLTSMVFVVPAARSDEDALKQALALESAIQQAVEKVEPSVACILVSRSDGYAKLAEKPGRPPVGKKAAAHLAGHGSGPGPDGSRQRA